MNIATLDDLFVEGSELPLITRMSERAQERHTHALWYAWGRDDAGNSPLSGVDSFHPMGNAQAFAYSAALDAERYEREVICYLSSVQGQFDRFAQFLIVLDLFMP